MKNKRLSTHLLGIFFSFLFSVCAVGCLQTGWLLHLESPAVLLIWCGVFAVMIPLLLYFRHGIWVLLLLTARGAFALWQDGELWKQIQTIAYVISSHFRDVYNWTAIGARRSGSYDLVLILLAYLTALSVSFCICRNRHSVFALIPAAAPLILCLITTDTLPHEAVLFTLIAGIVMILLTDWVRRNNPEKFTGLFLRLMIPAFAGAALLFLLNPQEEYVNRAADMQKMAVTACEKVKSAAEIIKSGNIAGSSTGDTVNLRSMGPKSNFSITVMRITSPYDGVVYLRGRDYDIYTGTRWESSADRSEIFPSGAMTGSENEGTMKVVTYGVRSVRYIPYYSAESITLTDGCLDNSGSAAVYSYTVSTVPGQYTGSGISHPNNYTDLPAETEQWALKLVKEILVGKKTAGEREIVSRIGSYVRNSAAYDLNTPAMSADYEDFAQWFLETGDTGYCVHFATSAAVLLRAAGIPARYVEGYMADCRADEKTLVSNQAAHAWVEYYDKEDAVWRILEATPSGTVVPTTVMTEDPEETEETAPAETDAPETEADESESAEPEETVPAETVPEDEDVPDTDNSGTGASTETGQTGQSHGSQTGGSGTSGTGGSNSGKAPAGGTDPDGTGSAGEKEPFVMPGWVKKLGRILLCVLLVAAAVEGQRYLRTAYRRKRWFSGTPNEIALERRRQLLYMTRRVGMTLPDELEELAQKAKFSQHTLTREELYRFELFRRKVLDTADALPWYRRPILRWIFAVG